MTEEFRHGFFIVSARTFGKADRAARAEFAHALALPRDYFAFRGNGDSLPFAVQASVRAEAGLVGSHVVESLFNVLAETDDAHREPLEAAQRQ